MEVSFSDANLTTRVRAVRYICLVAVLLALPVTASAQQRRRTVASTTANPKSIQRARAIAVDANAAPTIAEADPRDRRAPVRTAGRTRPISVRRRSRPARPAAAGACPPWEHADAGLGAAADAVVGAASKFRPGSGHRCRRGRRRIPRARCSIRQRDQRRLAKTPSTLSHTGRRSFMCCRRIATFRRWDNARLRCRLIDDLRHAAAAARLPRPNRRR